MKRDCTICIAKTKALITYACTAKLISAFVFACAKIRFSHDAVKFYFCNTVMHYDQGQESKIDRKEKQGEEGEERELQKFLI